MLQVEIRARVFFKYLEIIVKRALLVIDVQMEYFDGALKITYPVGHLEKILDVFDAATAAKVPIAVVRHHQPQADSPIFCLNSSTWQLHPEIQQRPSAVIIDKQLPGSFTGTDLDQWLKSENVDTCTIVGYMTQMCCDTTARQAFHLGYKVEFLNDATGTLDVANEAGSVTAQQLHESILVSQQMFISEVISTDVWKQRVD